MKIKYVVLLLLTIMLVILAYYPFYVIKTNKQTDRYFNSINDNKILLDLKESQFTEKRGEIYLSGKGITNQNIK